MLCARVALVQEIFVIPIQDKVTWYFFFPGTLSANPQDSVASVGYVNLNDPQLVPEFHAFFDGWEHKDDQGRQHAAQVEYAPCQVGAFWFKNIFSAVVTKCGGQSIG